MGEKMESNNELLLHIYKTSDMGVKSLTKLLNILKKKDNKIKKDISSELKEYECIYENTKKILEKDGIKKIGANLITSIAANSAMITEIDEDNSDSNIADILIRGYTMGIIESKRKMEDYRGKAEKSTIKLLNKLLKFQQESVGILQKYL